MKDYMMIAHKSKDMTNSYIPSKVVKDYLRQKLRYDIMKKEGHTDEVETRNLRRKKVYLLDKYIFPAMANLTYFFEFIAKNPELDREIFENDIEDLLLGIYGDPKKGHFSVFQRLVESIFVWEDNKSYTNNFRLIIMNILQYVLFYKVNALALREFGSEISDSMVQQDLGRALAWTKLLASRVVKDTLRETHRPVKF